MRPGDDIANCRLIEELGRGAWSTAWLAERGGQRVVVKMLRATVGDEKAQGARFYREVATVACLAGAGIVGLIDVGEVSSRTTQRSASVVRLRARLQHYTLRDFCTAM
jgi:serine/threonine protein kinase